MNIIALLRIYVLIQILFGCMFFATASFASDGASLEKEAQLAFNVQNYDSAQKLYEELAQYYSQNVGAKAAQTFVAKRNIILSIRGNGNYAQALGMLEKLTREMEQSLGAEHQETLKTQMEVAKTYTLLGRYEEAIKLNGKVITLQGKILNKKDEDYLQTGIYLVESTLALGAINKSYTYSEKFYTLGSSVFGQTHKITLQAQMYNGICLLALDEYKKAYVIFEDALNKARVHFSKKHALVLEIQSQMALAAAKVGQFSQAQKLMQDVVALQNVIFSPGHPQQLITQQRLASILIENNELEAAKDILQSILPKQQKVLGEKHSDTLFSSYYLGLIDLKMKRIDAAKVVFQKLFNTNKASHKNVTLARKALEAHIQCVYFEGEVNSAYVSLGALQKLEMVSLSKGHRKILETQNKLKTLQEKHPNTKFDHKTPQSLKVKTAQGRALFSQKKYQEALAVYEDLYTQFKTLFGDKDIRTIDTLFALGLVLKNLGDKNKAQSIFEQILPIYEAEFGEFHLKTIALSVSLQQILGGAGYHADAIPKLEEVCKNVKISLGEEHKLTLTLLIGLTQAYARVNDWQNVRDILEDKLQVMAQVLGEKNSLVVSARMRLARAYSKLGDEKKSEALYSFVQSQESSQKKSVEALVRQAALFFQQGKDSEAGKLLAQAHQNLEDEFGSYNLDVLAVENLQSLLLPMAKDAPDFTRKISHYLLRNFVRKQFHEKSMGAFALKLFVNALAAKDFKSAIFFGKLIILTEQEGRVRAEGLARELQQLLMSKKDKSYTSLIMLLASYQRHKEAFAVLSYLKAEELDDEAFRNITTDRHVKDFFTEIEYKLYLKLRSVASKAYALGEEIVPLEIRKKNLSSQDAKKLNALYAQVDSLKKELETLLFVETPEQVTQQSLFDYTQTGSSNLLELQDILRNIDNDAVFIHTVTTPKYFFTFLTSKDTFLQYRSKVSKEKIQSLVTKFRAQLADPNIDPRGTAQELYTILVQPLAKDLNGLQAKTLIFSLDGVLRYIPMSALHDGKNWLVEKYNIAIFNEAARKNLQKPVMKNPYVAAMGVTKALQGFSALPAVKGEIEGIVKENSQGILGGEKYLDDLFTSKVLSQTLSKDIPLVHVASHFQFDSTEQKNSFLLLGSGEKLSMGEMFTKENKFSFKNVKLLTLSACDTASGIKKGDGREIESFGALAQRHGAGAVLATLWSVSDASTAAFMQEFYATLGLDSASNAKALSQAQRLLLQGHITAQNASEDRTKRGKVIAAPSTAPTWTPKGKHDWSHPFYWAPFILMGNW